MDPVREICVLLGCEGDIPEKLRVAIRRFGFSDGELRYAVGQLPRWYDLDLPGMRQLLRLYVTEFLSLFDGCGDYRIFVSVPCPSVLSTAFNLSGRIRMYSAEFCSMVVLRGILGLDLYRRSTRCSCTRCAMLENRLAFLRDGLLPTPDLLWSFGLLCDECPKTDEQIASQLKLRTVSTLCHRMHSETSLLGFEASLRRDLSKVLQLAGIQSLPVEKARHLSLLMDMLLRDITACSNRLGAGALKPASLSLIHSTQLMAFTDPAALADTLSAIRKELRGRMPSQADALPFRLYCHFIPPCIPEFGQIFADAGIQLIGNAAFLSFPGTFSFRKDLAGLSASAWQSALIGQDASANAGKTAEALRAFRCDGYLTGMFAFDRWLGSGQVLTRRRLEGSGGEKVFYFGTDFWGRNFSPARLENYAQSIFELLNAQA